MDRIAIVGLGLIGGSIGLALKAAKLNNVEVVGCDMSRQAMTDAIRSMPPYFFSMLMPPLPTLISMPVVFCRS